MKTRASGERLASVILKKKILTIKEAQHGVI
jgi:hypothetical protein